MEDKRETLSLKWFNFYTNIMIIFCILNALSLSIYNNYFSNGIYNHFILFLFALDFSIVIYQFYVYYSLQKKEINSVNKLIVMLFINWIVKSMASSISLTENFTQSFIICVIFLSIYYVPNIIYFAKRKNIFTNMPQAKVNDQKHDGKEFNEVLTKSSKPIKKNITLESQNHKKEKKQNNINYNLLLIILISFLVAIFLFVGIYFLVDYIDSLKYQIESSQSSYNSIKTKYETLKKEHSDKELEYQSQDAKIDFFDEHVVFVLDGYGNYYYTYDQMQQVTQEKSYSYWAYNKEAAISKGYIAFPESSWEKYKREHD